MSGQVINCDASVHVGCLSIIDWNFPLFSGCYPDLTLCSCNDGKTVTKCRQGRKFCSLYSSETGHTVSMCHGEGTAKARRGICEQDTFKCTARGSQNKQNCLRHVPLTSMKDHNSPEIKCITVNPMWHLNWLVHVQLLYFSKSKTSSRKWHPPIWQQPLTGSSVLLKNHKKT
jgi:hypothetical protein